MNSSSGVISENADFHCNLANALKSQGKIAAAMAQYVRALELDPGHAVSYNNLGNILQSRDKLSEAIACYQKALTLMPEFADAAHNLGIALQASGKLSEAAACHRRARTLKPEFADAQFSEALAQLSQGDFGQGWGNYEARWKTDGHRRWRRCFPQPLWTGEALSAGSLLIWGEQGVGDEIMFAGLLPDVIQTGNRCTLDCDARLKPLFARSFPDVEVLSDHQAAHCPELDVVAQIPSGSLPGLFRKGQDEFSCTTIGYLKADPSLREQFRRVYSEDKRRVGLSWCTGNQKTGRMRSIGLPFFSPVFERTGIRWISLQYGTCEALEQQIAAANAPVLVDPEVDQLLDIDRFAAQVAAMDLVVTIDNSTAHLAGALGVPVWLLLPYAADWRWLRAGDKSSWYPSMRLFRQPKPGDWQSVIQSVAWALDEWPGV